MAAALLFALALGAATFALADPLQQKVNRAAAGWPLADFELTDQHGSPFTRENLQGRWTLLLLEDRHCPAPCEAALSALAGLFQRIQSTQAVQSMQVVLVSPLGEAPAAGPGLYMAGFAPRLVSVHGPNPALQRLADDLGASSRKTSGSIWLIGPDGIVRAELLPPYDVLLLTAEVLKTRARR